MIRKESLDALKPTQFKPGQSGNPKGRPEGAKSLTTILREYLEKDITLKADPITGEKDRRVKVKEMLTLALIKKATQGSEKANEMIWERLEGKVPQTMDITTREGLSKVSDDELIDSIGEIRKRIGASEGE